MTSYESGGERELWGLLRNGAAEAPAALAQAYLAQVYDLALRITLSPALAEGATRSTLERCAAEAAGRGPDEVLHVWLLTLARNEALDRLHGRTGIDEESEAGFLAATDERFSRLPSDHPQAGDPELARWAWLAVRGQRPRDYSLLDLSVRRGLSPPEVAEAASLSHTGVYSVLGRLRGFLEEAFTASVLFHRGARACPDLRRLIGNSMALGPALRREITRHAEVCAACRRTRAAFPVGGDIFAALAPVEPAPALQEAFQPPAAARQGALPLPGVAPSPEEGVVAAPEVTPEEAVAAESEGVVAEPEVTPEEAVAAEPEAVVAETEAGEEAVVAEPAAVGEEAVVAEAAPEAAPEETVVAEPAAVGEEAVVAEAAPEAVAPEELPSVIAEQLPSRRRRRTGRRQEEPAPEEHGVDAVGAPEEEPPPETAVPLEEPGESAPGAEAAALEAEGVMSEEAVGAAAEEEEPAFAGAGALAAARERIRFQRDYYLGAEPPRRPPWAGLLDWWRDSPRRGFLLLALLLFTIGAAYVGYAVGDSIRGSDGGQAGLGALATRAPGVLEIACGTAPISVPQGARQRITFASTALAGYQIDPAKLSVTPLSEGASPRNVNVTAEQGLAVLFEALALTGAPGRIDEYRLSVTFVRSGSEAIIADCLVRVTATQASTPVDTPTAAGTPSPTATPSPTPRPVGPAAPAATPTPAPTDTPLPTASPTPTNTPEPTPTPTRTPTPVPTAFPGAT
jgi:DNA-directed RNA polymerase specialized sigma24 family protein